MQSQYLKKKKLPDTPGVYFFKEGRRILYIGKATSLRDRVKSYFTSDLIQTRGPLIVDLINKADRIDFIKTDSVLEAIILEASLIKKHQPKYNTKEKDNKSFNYAVITKEDFPRILIVRGREIEKGLPYKIKSKHGPFTSGEILRNVLKIIRKIFPFRDRCVPLSGKPCFNRQLGLCPGVCDGSISKNDYLKIIRKIEILLSGRIHNLKNSLKKEMHFLSGKQEFEKAGEIKRQIFSLEHLQDVSLVSAFPALDKAGWHSDDGAVGNFRIEAYDAAHLSGTNNVGVMVVMEDGELQKSDYRKFKINNSQGNDIAALQEILERRLKHSEWPYPDLMVVDGGLAQLNIAKNGLHKSLVLGTHKGLAFVPIVAVTKDEHHKAKAIIGDNNIINKYKKKILLINAEAHRFAINFHRRRRSVIL